MNVVSSGSAISYKCVYTFIGLNWSTKPARVVIRRIIGIDFVYIDAVSAAAATSTADSRT